MEEEVEKNTKEVEKGKKEVEEDFKEVERIGKEVEKGDKEVKTNFKEVDGENREVVEEAKVLPCKEMKDDIVGVKMESMGGVSTLRESDQDIVKEIIQDLVKIATHFEEDLVQMEL